MWVSLLRRGFGIVVVIAYVTASVFGVSSAGSCATPTPEPHTHHDHGRHHHHSQHTPQNTASECLKCCLGACLVPPCLPGPTVGGSQPGFAASPVLDWAVGAGNPGRAGGPDPRPPPP